MQSVDLFLPDETATQSVGEKLAKCLAKGAIVYLSGPLGAGKTTLTRALLKAIGVSGSIKSPTYTLLEPYKTSSYSIYHFDFYRFFDQNEYEDSGFRDFFSEPEAICLVEWAEKAEGLIPSADLTIELKYGPDVQGRVIVFGSSSVLGDEMLNRLTQLIEC